MTGGIAAPCMYHCSVGPCARLSLPLRQAEGTWPRPGTASVAFPMQGPGGTLLLVCSIRGLDVFYSAEGQETREGYKAVRFLWDGS